MESLAKKAKKSIVNGLEEKFKRSAFLFFTNYKSLTVQEIETLRKNLKKAGVEYRVVKNTFSQRALEKIGSVEAVSLLDGPMGIVFAGEEVDVVNISRLLVDFAKEQPAFKIKGGILEKGILSEEKIREISFLPSREVLLGMAVGAIASPVISLVNILQGLLRGFVCALKEIEEKRK